LVAVLPLLTAFLVAVLLLATAFLAALLGFAAAFVARRDVPRAVDVVAGAFVVGMAPWYPRPPPRIRAIGVADVADGKRSAVSRWNLEAR